jgi:glycosyltransferase involved in cell wall biosynthesis
MEIQVTAIIPTVGRSSLHEAVKSAISQEGVKMKVLVVDDSESQNVEIEQAETKVIRTGGNKGVSFARNLGVKESKTEYIAFLDDDDAWLKGKISRQISEMRLLKLEISLTRAIVLTNNRSTVRPSKLINSNNSPLANLYQHHYPFSNRRYLPTATIAAERNIFLRHAFDINLYERENIEVLERIYTEGHKIVQLDFVGSKINYSRKNSLSRMSLERELHWAEKMDFLDKRLANNFRLESARNFLRIENFEFCKVMLDSVSNPRPIQRFFVLTYSMLTAFLTRINY